MGHIDYKMTVWGRVHFKDNTDMDMVTHIIDVDGLGAIFDEDLGFVEQETLFETEEEMTPEENGWNATIEVFNHDGDLIWDNEPDDFDE